MNIIVSTKAKKQLNKIPNKIFELILSKIIGLTNNSPNLNIRKLSNRDGFRLRVGDYRIIYKFEKTKVSILSIAHHKDAYRK